MKSLHLPFNWWDKWMFLKKALNFNISLAASPPCRILKVSVTLAWFLMLCWMNAPRSRTGTACGKLSALWLATGTTSSPRTRKAVSFTHESVLIKMPRSSNYTVHHKMLLTKNKDKKMISWYGTLPSIPFQFRVKENSHVKLLPLPTATGFLQLIFPLLLIILLSPSRTSLGAPQHW